jgi:hypothetical protein
MFETIMALLNMENTCRICTSQNNIDKKAESHNSGSRKIYPLLYKDG